MFYLTYFHTFDNAMGFKGLDIFFLEGIDNYHGQLRKYIGLGIHSSRNMRDLEEIKLGYESL